MQAQKQSGRGARVKRSIAAVIGAAALIAALTSTNAMATVVHNPRGHFLGVLPSTLHNNSLHAATANGSPPLTYHGGAVQHSSKAYAIFWAPSGTYFPASAKAEIAQYFNDVHAASYTTGNVYAAATQYCEGVSVGATSCSSASNKFVSYNTSYGGSVTVTTPFPANGCTNYTLGNGTTTSRCLVDSQLQTEINSVVAAHGWKTGLTSEVFLFTPPSVGECFDSTEQSCYDPEFSSGFCAYHSHVASPQTLYAFQPWADISGCIYQSVPNNAYPNDDGADTVVNVMSHEHNETITDPLGTAWFDSSGFENGDECAWLSLATNFNGIGDYSQTINGDQYLMQSEWSNRANSCVETNTFPQPTATFTAAAGSSAHSEKYTSSVSDSDDTSFRYSWSFGDGTSSSSVNPTHTYAAAGPETVTLTVFDAHGDQVRTSKTVTVS